MNVWRAIVVGVACVLAGCGSPPAGFAAGDGPPGDGPPGDDGTDGLSDGGVVADAPADALVDAPADAPADPGEPTDLVSMCGAVPVTLEDWERCFQRRWCEIVVNCSELNLYRDVEQCIAEESAVEGGQRSFDAFERARAVAAGTASLDTDAFTQCLVETSPRKCATSAHPAVCRRRFVGTVPDHQMCFSDIECASPGADCVQPAHCTESCCAGTCTPKPKVGEPCVDLVDGCEPGIVCGTDLTCVVGDIGAHCAKVFDCVPGAWCNNHTCVAARKPGEPCNVDATCDGETRCVGLVRRVEPPTCRRINHEGDACDATCLGNFVCDLSRGPGLGVCKAIATHGHACSGQLPCLGVDQICTGGVCVDRATQGQACIDFNHTCQPELFCSDQLGATRPICTARFADGQSGCNRPEQCKSHVCSGDGSASGICQALEATCR
jgi:hypothetical protein